MSLARSSVQKIPVLIMSQRPACKPGTIAENSILMYSDFRHRRLAISSPKVMRMPLSTPLLSTNCMGGSVGLVDITKVPGLTRSDAATFGVQV